MPIHSERVDEGAMGPESQEADHPHSNYTTRAMGYMALDEFAITASNREKQEQEDPVALVDLRIF